MTLQRQVDMLVVLAVQVAHICVEVLRANEELVGFLLGELHADGIDLVRLLSTHSTLGSSLCSMNEREEELGFIEHAEGPRAEFAVIGDRNDVVGVLGTNNGKRIDWVVVAMLCQARLLHWGGLGSNIPLKDVSRVGSSNYNVWLEWVEDGFGHLVLRSEGDLGFLPLVQGKDIDVAIRLVHLPLRVR